MFKMNQKEIINSNKYNQNKEDESEIESDKYDPVHLLRI